MPSRVTPVAGATVVVKVAGADINPALAHSLQEFVFEDSVHLPDMLELRFADPNRAYPEGTPFSIGQEISVKLHASGVEATEFKADITALSVRVTSDGVYSLTVRGLDKMHRLHRGRYTKTYEQVKLSDVVRQIVSEQGLTAGTIDSTEVNYPHLTIAGESHYAFLKRLSADNNMVLSFSDGKVHLKKRAAPSSPLQLSPKTSLVDLDITVTGGSLTKQVAVRGWDIKNKKMVEAVEEVKSTTIDIGSTKPADLTSKLSAASSKVVLSSASFNETAAATAMARSAAETVGGSFVEIQGTAHGDPRLRAGSSIELVDMPDGFKAKCVLSATRHVWDPRGYTTEFSVTADQDRSLLGMVNAGGQQRLTGVAPGVVTDNKDPDKLGRVRVRLPWLSQEHSSAWARVASIGAGKDRGLCDFPEVDDEVLVAFEHGDMDRPFVVGALWNGQDKIPDYEDTHFKGGKVQVRGFYTDKQKLVFDEKDGKHSVSLGMRDKTYLVTIDKGNTTIKVGSDGKVEIEAKDKVMITSKADVTVSATGKIGFEAKGAVSIKGMGVEIVDQAGASLKLQGTAALKGATVAIN